MADDLQTIVQRMIDAGEPESNIATVIQGYQSSVPPAIPGTATALATGANELAVPALQSGARLIANHPAAAQRAIASGVQIGAGGAGAAIGGGPGALVGASIRGVTPSQGAIRTVAGEIAGEALDVARHAGRAQAVINYAKPQGIKLTPGNLRSVPENPALDNYAESVGQKVLRLYGPNGEQVVGPMTPIEAGPAPLASKIVPGLTRALGYLQAGTGVTDLAQMLEPKRQDIGVMGIGRTVPFDREANPTLAHWLATKAGAARDAVLAAMSGQP